MTFLFSAFLFEKLRNYYLDKKEQTLGYVSPSFESYLEKNEFQKYF